LSRQFSTCVCACNVALLLGFAVAAVINGSSGRSIFEVTVDGAVGRPPRYLTRIG